MVRLDQGVAELKPIAGTRRRGASEQEDRRLADELLEDPKERAEHVMLVDLGRNDLGRIAQTGSVQVNQLMAVERYSHVMHLVSDIQAQLAPGKDAYDVLRATFPAGTLTGAPKVRAMEIIAELEPARRGAYGGAVGYFGYGGSMDFCITIRTMLLRKGKIFIQAGAGIVADSDPEAEYQGDAQQGGSHDPGRPFDRSGIRTLKRSKTMILMIDNYDSFTYNLVQYLGQLGEEVVVRRNDEISLDEIETLAPEAIFLSPGPCSPEQAGISVAAVRQFHERIPILGVCLGHQAIGHAFGGRVVRAERIMHGKTSPILNDGKTIFAGLPSPFPAGRYHSLLVERATLPDCLEISAETEEGEIMGFRHRRWPVEGIQFHPESILTPAGKRLIKNFLNMIKDKRRGDA